MPLAPDVIEQAKFELVEIHKEKIHFLTPGPNFPIGTYVYGQIIPIAQNYGQSTEAARLACNR